MERRGLRHLLMIRKVFASGHSLFLKMQLACFWKLTIFWLIHCLRHGHTAVHCHPIHLAEDDT